MASIPDLMSLLCLDPRQSKSPFGGQHRTILISKDYTNFCDFAFQSLLQHFSRKDPNSPILLVSLSHDWTNYSASAAKCGFNLRKSTNMGNIEQLDLMSEYMESIRGDVPDFNPCRLILETITKFLKKHNTTQSETDTSNSIKPLVVMIDDLSILLTLGSKTNEVFQLYSLLEKLLRDRSSSLQPNTVSHLVVQTMINNYRSTGQHHGSELNYLVSNLENLCDISLTLKPLDSGYSTRVDGTIKIVDNRLPLDSRAVKPVTPSQRPMPGLSLFPVSSANIGTKKAYFFKLSDRRARLTSNALIF